LSESEQTPASILLVDDEPAILSALRRLFRPHGYRVLMAEGGAAGLALLAVEKVDLVISDMRMPEMDGVQFLERVRSGWPATVRMLLTGYADIGSTIAAINRGEIHRYLTKPWEDQDLLLSVRDALTRHRLESENHRLLALVQQQNEQLQLANNGLEQAVQARTQELAQINDMLSTAYAQLEQNFLLSLKVFASLLELREGSVVGFSRRVAHLCMETAKRLALDKQTQQDVFAAGLLHEVGKIGLPDAMLRKPLSLMNGEELGRYRRHPIHAEAAMLALPRLQRVAHIVRMHQERIDGKGFPDGLSGDEVPVAAQIVGLACTYEALRCGRMSEKKFSQAEAAAVLRGGAGTRHAVAVVQAFDEMLAAVNAEPADDRPVTPQELQTGMVLARDLLSPQGNLLLASGFVFDSRVIRQIQEFSRRDNLKLDLRIRRAEAPAPAPAA